MITTLIVLYAAKTTKRVQFEDFNRSTLFKVSLLFTEEHLDVSFQLHDTGLSHNSWCLVFFPCQIFPLPLLYVGNHITGLASTQKLRFNLFCVTLTLLTDAIDSFTCCFHIHVFFLQLTHVHGVTEIHHINDNGLGSTCTKVWHMSKMLLLSLYQKYDCQNRLGGIGHYTGYQRGCQ